MSSSSGGFHQHKAGHRLLERKSSGRDHPRRLALPCSGMSSPYENVTGVVMASEYHCMPASSPQPWDWNSGPYGTVLPRTRVSDSRIQAMHHLQASPARRSLNHIHWADVDGEHDRLATPPKTPQIGRLESPKLEPLRCSGRFCDCCPDEQRYYDERGKMDSQGGCICCKWDGLSSQMVV